MDVEPHMAPQLIARDGQEMVGRGAERRSAENLLPFSGGGRISLQHAGIDRSGRRIVAGEVAGIDIDAADASLRAEFNDAEVMSAVAPPARLPAIHPFAVIVIFA